MQACRCESKRGVACGVSRCALPCVSAATTQHATRLGDTQEVICVSRPHTLLAPQQLANCMWVASYVDALHFCIDGNFHLGLKPKHTDLYDFPLTKGAVYFVHEDNFKQYIATTKPYLNEVSAESRRHCIVTDDVSSHQHVASSSPWEVGPTQVLSPALLPSCADTTLCSHAASLT